VTEKANVRHGVPDDLKTGLPPIAGVDARLFILGSMPGDASLAAGRYYAHPQNQFWRLVGSVIGEDLPSMDYAQRLGRLAAHRIGLWDVVNSAVRRGSLDQAIRDADHNRIEHLVHDFPNLEAIGFNGGTSATIGRKLIGSEHRLTLIDLPSSSPANTRPFVEKAAAWASLRPFIGQPLVRADIPAKMQGHD
jgi:double-stranded uracil-DNA glycosylase